jgi:hypothetical protein
MLLRIQHSFAKSSRSLKKTGRIRTSGTILSSTESLRSCICLWQTCLVLFYLQAILFAAPAVDCGATVVDSKPFLAPSLHQDEHLSVGQVHIIGECLLECEIASQNWLQSKA